MEQVHSKTTEVLEHFQARVLRASPLESVIKLYSIFRQEALWAGLLHDCAQTTPVFVLFVTVKQVKQVKQSLPLAVR
jgi:HD superfamily phosphohydrolase YqeK